MTSSRIQLFKSFCQQRNLPLIPIQSSRLSVLPDPKSFYNVILDKIDVSKHRVALSALYLGVGRREEIIVSKLRERLKTLDKMQVDIFLDKRRATRPDHLGRSSMSILEPIATMIGVSINLVETRKKSTLHSMIDKFSRLNEIPSIYHTKMMIFDDDVLITGANLSELYFEQRRDRYMVVEKSKILCDYLFKLLNIFGQQKVNLKSEIDKLNSSISTFLDNSKQISDTYIIPLVQFGSQKITADEDFLKHLDRIRPKNSELFLSSGYLNPSDTVSSIRIDSILAASREANNFSKGSGILQQIPNLYYALYRDFLERHDCQFRLYNKPDWSFHAKGLWIEGMEDTSLTVIGSSNYNYRSSKRDLEVQLVIITTDPNLKRIIGCERLDLWKDSKPLLADDLRGVNYIHRAMANVFKSFL